LQAWAELLSSDTQTAEALHTAAKLLERILEKYYPDNFDTNLALLSTLECAVRLMENQVDRIFPKGFWETEAVVKKKIDDCKTLLKDTIQYWPKEDPIHFNALSWYKNYFCAEEFKEKLQEAIK
jgi:hypothetical protein